MAVDDVSHRRDQGVLIREEAPAAPSGEGSPLSWFQERLWVHHRRSPEDTSYNLPLLLTVRGDLDVPALEQSVNAVVARHESLRTWYGETAEGEPLQFVAPPRHVPLPALAVGRAEMPALLDRFLDHRFDLRRGPIFIASLLRLSADEHLLLLNVHHIAADAWSLKAILLAELQSAYAAFCRAEQPALPPLTVQYRDYASRQRTADMSADLDYWRETLAGYEDSLEVPATHPRQLKSGTRSGSFTYSYSPGFARDLERFSREHGSTVFMCLLAALGVTLSRYADKDDLCIGTTTSNRSDVEVEPLIGFFINILPLRMRIDEKSSVAGLLETVRARVLDAFEHPVPFERILQATDAARRGSGNPLVPIVMRQQNFPRTSLGAALPGDVTFEPFPGPGETDEAVLEVLVREDVPARCEIELSYSDGVDGLAVEVVYAADLYDRAAVERLLAHHQHVLEGMFGDPGRPVLEIPLLRDSDVAELLGRGERVVTEAPARSFVERFAAQVERAPEAVACWDSRGAWSYLDLDRRSRRVAHALAARGTAPGDLVAVCLPRGGDLLATLLGVWRAGAAYVPIDPAYPTAYSRQILDDAGPSAIVCDARHRVLLGVEESRCLTPDQIGAAPAAGQAEPVRPDSLAYVMYTSGSTGKPKGVRVPHRQLDNWLSSLEQSLPFQAGEVVAQKTTFVFAVGVKELFAGLLNGCPQVFIDDDTVRDVAAFVDALAEHHVSRLNILPSHLAGVIEHLKAGGRRLPALKVCVTAGEPLPKAHVLDFRAMFPGAALFNNYGCTEVNDITYYDTAGFDGTGEFVPIGTPIANTEVFVLDRHGRLVPDGVAGELHVASMGLPDGYHGLDSLTAERFRPHPFGAAPGTRLYNTGDVVRRLPDGTLDFIGRYDFQVKVRGFRVDVRQVETVMGDFEGIRARAVVGHGDRLTAFYTSRPDRAVQLTELRAFLQDRLPAYMVPDTFVLLDAMPQLPNGKLNRRALLETRGEPQQSGAYEPPASATERTLAGIWGLIVNVPATRIGRQTHFFEIGGHSLAAMRVLARIKDTFQVEIGLSKLFDAPRLESLAAVIDREIGHRPSAGRSAAPRTSKPPTGSGLLHDKVVLVTGGSRGIGLATALLLAEQGAKVAINYRDSEAQARSVQEMIEAEGGTAEIFGADVTRADEVAAMVAAVHERFERIDVLVANAHMHFRHRPFLEYDWADLERKVNDELKAVFHPCQAVAPEMLRRRSGSIIAVSSTLSKRSNAGFLAQSTAKAAVDAFIRSLATELGPHGVRANTVAPGLTLTDAAMPMAPHVKESIAAGSPMRRNGLPEDMAGAVLFLASDLSRFMTGTYLPVDGGFTTL
jgi:amino acid adenylation domain-containing protein